jgi:hypothetical protein
MTDEKRAYDRLVFPAEKKVQVTFVSADDNDILLSARVLNISQGGLGLAAVKSQDFMQMEENELILQSITGEEKLHCLKGQAVRVKWILNSEIFDNYGVGCEFVELNDESFECLGKLCNGG